ncbi:hypothetical protein Ocin01_15374 [Orchesella cincta]|uniref:DUF4789 domain-containing protein n=1 Tax=Orchesella cincta TaxID=48709 RepID=A0A1D2ME85_ORCCI|nr:hypothetical protein Ocin01_15374 [Orchesella cincta]
MSNTCKWISFGVVSLGVVVILVFLYHLSQENNSKCPNEGELMQNDTRECFKRETKGPCFNNLVFVEDKPRSPYGACSCPYMEFNRTIIYYEGQCYFVFSQAYCNEGYWLNVTTHGEPVCELNPCSQQVTQELEAVGVEWVQIKDGRCVQLGKWAEGCPEGSTVRFSRNYVRPSCFQPVTLGQTIGAISAPSIRKCPAGSYLAISGKCQPTMEFDFDY